MQIGFGLLASVLAANEELLLCFNDFLLEFDSPLLYPDNLSFITLSLPIAHHDPRKSS